MPAVPGEHRMASMRARITAFSQVQIRGPHEVELIPPAYVKAYVRRQKNDAADAAAICEAVTRPAMRFVPVKSAEQQAVIVLHWVRELVVG
jgi:transposase